MLKRQATIIVAKPEAGQRLLDLLCRRFSYHTPAEWEAALAAGRLLLNGTPAAATTMLAAGDRLEYHFPEIAEPEVDAGYRILFEDASLLAIDKPAGLPCHPAGKYFRNTLWALLHEQRGLEPVRILHRLDRETSGVVLVAKSEAAYTVLKQAFRSRNVSKTYHTLVQGHPDPLEGTIEAPIGRHPGADYKMAVIGGGRHSVTHYKLLEAFRSVSLLEVHLETGRTHQIRVHMQAIKHPCVGDPTYGGDPVLAARLGLQRQWLHAVQLSFLHPRSGELVTFDSAYPEDLAAALELLRH